jgi:hypothetical protein
MQLLNTIKDKAADPKAWKKFHLAATFIWAMLVIPTALFWNESVLWIGLISCYANMVGHFSAWQASRAEDNGSK